MFHSEDTPNFRRRASRAGVLFSSISKEIPVLYNDSTPNFPRRASRAGVLHSVLQKKFFLNA